MDLNILNERQQEAVKTTEGRIRVIAGAGSGKTRVLAYRYAYLNHELGVDASRILCLTFTNKAAQEMRSRISSIVGREQVGGFICTIHSFCVRFLREEIFRIGYPKTFPILDAEDMESIAKEAMTELNINRKDLTTKQLISRYERWKDEDDYVGKYIVPLKSGYESEVDTDIFTNLLFKQKKFFALDFKDLISFTLFILKSFPEVKRNWAERIKYLMIDEAQDCSLDQWEIFEILSSLNNNLFVVGDPDQCIYEWRGAKVELLVDLESDKDIVLERNYRSTGVILDAANSIIENNKLRVKKNLFTENARGTTITHFHAKSEQEEADWISKKIIEDNKAGGHFSDSAILLRASHLSRSIEQSFIRFDINYVVWGGVRFFERKEVKDLLAYLRLIVYEDDMSFKRIVNVPSRKIGNTTVKEIESIAEERKCSLFSALAIYSALKFGVAKQSIEEFISLITEARNRRDSVSISELAEYVLKESGLKALYRDDVDEERLENLNELIYSIRLYEDEHKEDDITLEDYLQDVALYTNIDYRKDKDQVRIMTIHQAKGLEFPNVYISGLSEGIFPNDRSVRDRKEKGMEEERRLMYVAVTRAEKNLYLTESEGFTPKLTGIKHPSRFIKEIKSQLFVTEGQMPEELWATPGEDGQQFDVNARERFRPHSIVEGDRVYHPHLGRGIVTAINKDYPFCDVTFDSGRVEEGMPTQFLKYIESSASSRRMPLSIEALKPINTQKVEDVPIKTSIEAPPFSVMPDIDSAFDAITEHYKNQPRLANSLKNALRGVNDEDGYVFIRLGFDSEAQRDWIAERKSKEIDDLFKQLLPYYKLKIQYLLRSDVISFFQQYVNVDDEGRLKPASEIEVGPDGYRICLDIDIDKSFLNSFKREIDIAF